MRKAYHSLPQEIKLVHRAMPLLDSSLGARTEPFAGLSAILPEKGLMEGVPLVRQSNELLGAGHEEAQLCCEDTR